MDAHARKCKTAFGLDRWNIGISRKRNLRPGGIQSLGYHVTTYRTLTSDIQYEAALRNDDLGHDVMTHEFLHVALIQQDRAVTFMLDFVPKQHRNHCQRLYAEAQEHTIESLSRSLTPVLRAVDMDGGKGKDKKEGR
jgi:hypothetical protein